LSEKPFKLRFDIYFNIQLGIIDGIRNSSVILCCITRKYTESKNCKREIAFADKLSKPIEILMFERLEIGDIGSIGFIINPIVRHNLYKIPQIFKDWKGTEFDTILKCVKGHLRPSTGSAANRPSSSKASNDTINTQATKKCKAEETKAKWNQTASGSLEKGTNCKKNFPKFEERGSAPFNPLSKGAPPL